MEINLNNVYDSMIIDPVMGLIRDKVGRSSQDNAKFAPLSRAQISSEWISLGPLERKNQ